MDWDCRRYYGVRCRPGIGYDFLNFSMAIDEENIERYDRIPHPHLHDARWPIGKKHPVAHRKMNAVHQPSGALGPRLGQFDCQKDRFMVAGVYFDLSGFKRYRARSAEEPCQPDKCKADTEGYCEQNRR